MMDIIQSKALLLKIKLPVKKVEPIPQTLVEKGEENTTYKNQSMNLTSSLNRFSDLRRSSDKT